jgi:hypothetical protein
MCHDLLEMDGNKYVVEVCLHIWLFLLVGGGVGVDEYLRGCFRVLRAFFLHFCRVLLFVYSSFSSLAKQVAVLRKRMSF